ncbi:MAG: zf-TFIIB domain-containing protein [Deltaproteobacteria bacterium]|nr:zf-TFIIB domain-containing protein [Deltaproteobacteria bacterium]
MQEKPDRKEDEYFARQEYEKRKKLEAEKQRNLAADEKKRLKELHHMKCPKCGMNLVEIDFKGIRIDKCTECEGIWLDAGEIDMVAKLGKAGFTGLFSIFRN